MTADRKLLVDEYSPMSSSQTMNDNDDPVQIQCKQCAKSSNDMKKCSVCLDVYYCSVECQKADWTSHKKICTQVACRKLIQAIEEDQEDIVKSLAKVKRVLNGKVDYQPLDNGAGPEGEVLGKWSALHECVRKKRPGLMEILIENKANLEIKDVDGETPAFVASTQSDGGELLRILFEAGANPHATASARDHNTDNVMTLLEFGANVHDGHDMFGRTALDIVALCSTGQGLRKNNNQTYEEAKEECEYVKQVLTLHANNLL